MRSIVGLLLLLMIRLAGAPCVAEDEPDPDAALRPKVDEIFVEWDRDDSPGCTMAAIRDGAVVYARGYGMANLEYGLPLEPSSVFRIGSTSKQFTAMAVLLLAEEGKIALDDDIRKYLPELHEFDPPLTVRQLIHHTSGVRDYLTLMYLSGFRDDDYYTDAEVMEMLARQSHVNFEPGSRHLYSNAGYFLLSQIVLRVSEKTLAEYGAEKIFGPLGMKDTHYHDDHRRIVPRRASGYASDGAGGWVIHMTTLPMIGDGGVFATVEDLLLWDRNFYDNKLGRGGQELIGKMIATGELTNGEGLSYASGLTIGKHRGLDMISHGGAFVGFRAEMARFPAHRFSVAVLCNVASSNPSRLALDVADIYLGDHMEPEVELPRPPTETTEQDPEFEIDPSVYDAYIGNYELMPDLILTVTRDEDRLMVQPTGQPKAEMVPESETLFFVKVADAKLAFERDESGRVTALTVYQLGRERRAERLAELAEPGEDELGSFVGEYYSAELDTTYRISLEDGALSLRVRRLPPMTLQPSGPERLSCEFGLLHVDRAEDGTMAGFELDAGRVEGLTFERK